MGPVGRSGTNDFDYGTPEAQAALAGVSKLILEVRDEYALPVAPPSAEGDARAVVDPSVERKLRLYERTLGLAVIPVLVRRLVYRAVSATRRGPGGR